MLGGVCTKKRQPGSRGGAWGKQNHEHIGVLAAFSPRTRKGIFSESPAQSLRHAARASLCEGRPTQNGSVGPGTEHSKSQRHRHQGTQRIRADSPQSPHHSPGMPKDAQ